MRRVFVVVLTSVLMIVSSSSASAAAGDLDPTFGQQGIAFASPGPFSSSHDVAILSDGRLIEVGYTASESQPFFGIGASGSLFGADGDLIGGFGTARGILNAYHEVVAYPGGGAVIAGWAQRCLVGTGLQDCTALSRGFFMIVKVRPDGSPDTSFDGDGVVLTSLGAGDAIAESIAVQADGKIVAVGSASNAAGAPLIAVARYRVDGSLDPTFGNGGRVLLSSGTAMDVAVDATGRIVIAGGASSGFVVVRLLPGGGRDLSFGQQGRVMAGFVNRSASATDLALASGKIVVGGSVLTPTAGGSSVTGFALMRLTSAGALDVTFDSDGKVITTFNAGDAGLAELAVTAAGKIIAAGGPGVARYTSGGQRDRTFSGDGRVWLTDPFTDQFMPAQGLTLQGSNVVVSIDDADAMAVTRVLL